MMTAAFVTITASYLIYQHQLFINQLENHLALNQSRLMADASFEWSKIVLLEDSKLSNVDHLKEPWATRIPLMQFEGGTVEGFIRDAQGLCNLNNLIGVKGNQNETAQNFKQMIRLLGGEESTIDALIDWIDPDYEVTSPGGAEDNFYLTQASPYRAGNQPLSEIGNLSRINGFTPELITQLKQYCVALPEPTPLNINTASADVIKVTFPELTAFDVESIIAQRNIQPFQSNGEVMKLLENKKINIGENRLSVNSKYFLVNTIVRFGKTTTSASALLKRDGQDLPKIIWKRYS
jgi:general secretion pathway protein K